MDVSKLKVECAELNGVFDVMQAIVNNIDDVPSEVREAFDAFIEGRGRKVGGYAAAVCYSDMIEAMNKPK